MSFARRYVAFLARHDLGIALAALVLFALSIMVSTQLKLRSAFTELLPQDDPELVQLQKIGDRIGAPSTLIVAIEGPNPTANERFAEALVRNLAPLVGTDLQAIDYRADAGKAFFEHNKALYARLDDLERIEDDVRKLLVSKKNPAFIPFADDAKGEVEDDPARDLKRLKTELDKTPAGPYPNGYYETKDRSLLAVVTWTRSSGLGDVSGFRIRDDVQHVVDVTDPASFGLVTARLTGDVPSGIEEHDALKADIEWVSLVCSVLVLIVISAYYRSVLSLAYVFFPTLLGVSVAFGITALTIGYLNTNTAFLGSIILGNGINFGIILLARYREERRRRRDGDVQEALAVAIHMTARPTLAAAFAAGIAYGSLALTRFRGFQQFGEVGGVGMILCWMATYSYCPALIHLLERWRRRRGHEQDLSVGVASRRLVRVADALFYRRRFVLGVVFAASALAAWSLAPLARNPFEYDFSKLRNQSSRKHGAGDLYVRMAAIFSQDIAPTGVALLAEASDAPLYRDAQLRKDCVDAVGRATGAGASSPDGANEECTRRVSGGEPTTGLLSAVVTAHDYLPKDQGPKLRIIAHIRRLLADPAVGLLSDDQRRQLLSLSPRADLHELAPADLPDGIARRFREVDGTVGRVALIYPVRVWANWDGHSLIRISDVMKDVALPNGRVVNAAGTASLFAAMLRSIVHDGPIATRAAFVGVIVMVMIVFHNVKRILGVVLALLVGVLWMGGGAAALGLKLNFLNFVALPVTLGIGVDYAVNVFARLGAEPSQELARALAETGSAVLLCSSTTIIGYSSLLIASNGALRSFGKLAVLGELGCVLAALLLAPGLSRWYRRPSPLSDQLSDLPSTTKGNAPGPR